MPTAATAEIPEAEIRAQVDRILKSAAFSRSKRQQAFLEFITNAALEGRPEELKEYTLGVEVFQRDDAFDPSSDSIVRVEASRLRTKLRDYYDAEGWRDPVVVEMPKGHYAPTFQPAKSSSRYTWKPFHWAVSLGVVLVISLAAAFLNLPGERPSSSVDADNDLPNAFRLAVLPLQNHTAAPDEYFTMAITEQIITALVAYPNLRVTSLRSAMWYAGTEARTHDIGQSLDVDYLVVGTIVEQGSQKMLNTRLISVQSDEYVWSQAEPSPIENRLPYEIAAGIAEKISGNSVPPGQQTVSNLNPAAHEAFMKGRYFFNQFTADGFRRSRQFFQRAIEIEPTYAEALAGLASCHCLLAGHGLEMESPVVALPQATAFAQKALELRPGYAEPIGFLGIIKFKYDWDLSSAEDYIARAIAANPSDYQAYVWQSQILEATGRHDQAIAKARIAKSLDPLSPAASLNLAWQLYQAKAYVAARAEIDKLIDFDPTFWGGHWASGQLHSQLGQLQNAIADLEHAVELGGGHSLPLATLGYAFAVANQHEDASRVLAELDQLQRTGYVSPFHIATVYAGLEQPDRMFEYLEDAFDVRARSLAWLSVTRELSAYRDDERYQSLVRRIGI